VAVAGTCRSEPVFVHTSILDDFLQTLGFALKIYCCSIESLAALLVPLPLAALWDT